MDNIHILPGDASLVGVDIRKTQETEETKKKKEERKKERNFTTPLCCFKHTSNVLGSRLWYVRVGKNLKQQILKSR